MIICPICNKILTPFTNDEVCPNSPYLHGRHPFYVLVFERDGCQVCHGLKRGVPGNENVVDGVVMCDYCHAEKIAEERRKPCICAQGVTKCPQHGEQPAERGLCPLCGTVLGYCPQGEYCTQEKCKYVC